MIDKNELTVDYEGVVNENTVLEVGKFYNVRCAIMIDRGTGMNYTLPVIGNIHTDKQFGFPDKHIHVDGRFCGEREKKYIYHLDGRTNHVCSLPPSATFSIVIGFITKKMKCKRLDTGVMPPDQTSSGVGAVKYWNWVESMIGKSCKGKKCPHFGTTMLEKNGKLVCPLHNLMADSTGSEIIGAYTEK